MVILASGELLDIKYMCILPIICTIYMYYLYITYYIYTTYNIKGNLRKNSVGNF